MVREYADLPVLQKMRVEDIVTNWRPATHDEEGEPNLDWTWEDEINDVFTNPEQISRTLGVARCINDAGIGYIDYVAPILLGNDGRVWDGHHRICIALVVGIEYVMVEVA